MPLGLSGWPLGSAGGKLWVASGDLWLASGDWPVGRTLGRPVSPVVHWAGGSRWLANCRSARRSEDSCSAPAQQASVGRPASRSVGRSAGSVGRPAGRSVGRPVGWVGRSIGRQIGRVDRFARSFSRSVGLSVVRSVGRVGRSANRPAGDGLASWSSGWSFGCSIGW